jgi:hypothetical protein
MYLIKLENSEPVSLEIRIDLFISNDNRIQETIDVENNVEKILDDIKKIIEDYGYCEMHHAKSPMSTTLYFTFCDEAKFNSEEVELVARLRVADHSLPKRNNDKTNHDAEDRQLYDLQKFANKHKYINKKLKQDDDMPVKMLYVKYENEFYTDLEYVYNKIRKKLEWFRHKYG